MQWFSDFLYQWITLFLFAIALCFMAYFLAEKDQTKMLWCGFVAWVLMGGALAIFLNTKVLVEPTTQGVLVAALEPMPQGTFSRIPEDALRVYLGDSLAYCTGTFMTVIRIGDREILTIRRTDRGLFVNAELRSADGRIVAEIKDNQFEINQNNFFKRSRPDRHTLIVYDQENTEVLNVRFLNRSAIRIIGVFHISAVARITIKADAMHVPGNVFRHYLFGGGGDGFTAIQVGSRTAPRAGQG